MVKINLAIVHGIGVNTQGYAQPLISGVRRQFNKELRNILGGSADYSQEINFIPIAWDDIVAFQEAALVNIFRKEFDQRNKRGLLGIIGIIAGYTAAAIALHFFFRHWFVFLFVFASLIHFGKRLYYWLRTNFAAEFIGDVTSYTEKGTKDLILQRIESSLKSLAGGAEDQNLSFVSHSLGTVIASDFVWERQKPGGLLAKKIFLSNFFTMGSPLPLFSLQFGGPEIFNKPISLKDTLGRWVNIYDAGDPIAYPLKPLNKAYERVVLKDQRVWVGIFGVAHVKYWGGNKVHLIIARKLALDWLRFNQKLDKAKLDKLYADYDKSVGLRKG